MKFPSLFELIRRYARLPSKKLWEDALKLNRWPVKWWDEKVEEKRKKWNDAGYTHKEQSDALGVPFKSLNRYIDTSLIGGDAQKYNLNFHWTTISAPLSPFTLI